MPELNVPCLEVRGLTGFYGETQALHGIDFVVQPITGQHSLWLQGLPPTSRQP